jgi:hypothetical protein
MKCRICGSDAPKGAKLCKDCAAARKRAFAATVTQPLLLAAAGAPSVDRPRFAPKPSRPKNPTSRSPAIQPIQPVGAAPAPPRPAPAAPRAAPPRRNSRLVWPFVVVAVAGVLLAATIAWVLVRHDREPAPADTAAPAPAASTVAALPGPAPEEPAAAVPVADPGLEMGPPASLKPRQVRKSAAPAEQTPAPTPPPVVAAEPAPRPPAPAQRAPEPVRSDPVQSLNQAIARCASLELFSRPACEQQARDQYCGNAWGQIPQCPIGRGNDHGQ